MGSCVSKKAARAGAGGKGKVAAPLPVVEKESAHHAHQLPPVLEVEAEVEEEEVKEVVLSETPAPRPPRPPTPSEPVKRRKAAEQPEADDEAAAAAASETCSASDSAASVASSAAKAKLLHKAARGGEREVEVEKRAVDAPEKARTAARRTTAPEERESRKHKGGGSGHGRARSPSPSSAHRRQQQQSGGQGQQHHQHPPAPRPRPAVVSGIGCRSGRFSPSAARRAAESAAAVRRTHSAREADMALPSKRSLCLNNVAAGHGGGSSAALCRRDPGERSGRRSESPTGGSRRAPASPSPSAAIQRPASPMRNKAAAKERHGTPERARPPPRAALGGGVGGEQRKVAEGAPLGHNNPSVAMECFIFL